MAVARNKRVIRREWTRDEVKEEEALKRQNARKGHLQSLEAHAWRRETESLCARNPCRSSSHQVK